MKSTTVMVLFAAVLAWTAPLTGALAQTTGAEAQQPSNRIESLQVAERGGSLLIRLTLSEPLENPPASFSIANPARIAFDFPDTANALGRTQQDINRGDLRSANIVQAGDRTRLVLNMTRVTPYDTRLEGRDVIIALSPAVATAATPPQVAESATTFAAPPEASTEPKNVQDITFRRGPDGEGRVVVQLSSPDTGIDIRRQGANLVVEFLNASLPGHLHRRSDVTDFGTPITTMTAQPHGSNVRLTVTPHGLWEHNAYQSDTQFVLEVRRIIEDPSRLVQGARPGEFAGEKLSLNFQNIDIRSVLQVIADFTDFNIVTSDSVQGDLTLRLKDVPWDQALDVVLNAKGLSYTKTGNVIAVAPTDELEQRQHARLRQLQLEQEIEPVQTEVYQINYHQAAEVAEILRGQRASVRDASAEAGAPGAAGAATGSGVDGRSVQGTQALGQRLLSDRGSVSADIRSNKIFVSDVAASRENIRAFLQEIDVAPRQVLIEARIVEARTDFARDLGVRLGVGGVGGRTVGFDAEGRPIRRATIGGGLGSTASNAGQVTDIVDLNPGGLNVNLPAPPGSGALSMVLWNNAATRFLNLELSALEARGRGRVISSPRILTANQAEAMIRQGDRINVRVATADGFDVREIDASLRMTVTPSITPDNRVQLAVSIMKDRADFSRVVDGIPAIETREANTRVLVENGGTVVIGGVFEEDEIESRTQVPFLGDIPVVGNLFRTDQSRRERRELLIFITPRLVSDNLTLR